MYITLGDFWHHSPINGETNLNNVSKNPTTDINCAISDVPNCIKSLKIIGNNNEKFVSTQDDIDNPSTILTKIGSESKARSKKCMILSKNLFFSFFTFLHSVTSSFSLAKEFDSLNILIELPKLNSSDSHHFTEEEWGSFFLKSGCDIAHLAPTLVLLSSDRIDMLIGFASFMFSLTDSSTTGNIFPER